MTSLHDRMPVILPRRHHELWLDPAETGPQRLASVLQPFPADRMTAFPVSTVVNAPANDVPECVEPLPDWQKGTPQSMQRAP